MTNLNKKIQKLFLFSFLDLLVIRFSKYAGILILISVVSKETIGILGIATGYLSILSYMLFAPEHILLRDYPNTRKMKGGKFSEVISSYMNFWVLKSILALFFGFLIFLFIKNSSIVLGIVFLGLLIQRLLNHFESLVQLVFYVDFKQDLVTKVDFLFNSILLLLFFILFFFHSIFAYIGIIVIGELIICIVWLYLIRHYFKFSYKYVNSWILRVKHSFLDFTLWYDLGISVMNMLQQAGPVILSFFVSLTLVGDYTIALKISGLFLIIPVLLQKTGLVHFSNETKESEISLDKSKTTNKTLRQYLLIHGFLSLAYIGTFILLGKPLIYVFLTKQNIDVIYQLTVVLLVGIGIYNVARPFVTLAMARLSLQSIFLNVYLPVGILGIIIYLVLAMNFGAFGLAFASIVNYILFLALIVNLTHRLR